MDDLKRVVTLLLASIVALSAMLGYACFAWPDMKQLSPDARDAARYVGVEIFVVFFGMLYWSGRVIARMLRARELAEEIRWRSRWHMRVLHLGLGATILIGRGFMLQRQAGDTLVNQIMIGVGVGILVLSLVFFLRGPRVRPRTG